MHSPHRTARDQLRDYSATELAPERRRSGASSHPSDSGTPARLGGWRLSGEIDRLDASPRGQTVQRQDTSSGPAESAIRTRALLSVASSSKAAIPLSRGSWECLPGAFANYSKRCYHGDVELSCAQPPILKRRSFSLHYPRRRRLAFLRAFAAMSLVAILHSNIHASVGQDAHSGRPLHAVRDWVQRTGKPTVIRSHIVRAIGWPDADVPVRERGFKTVGEVLTHVCAAPDSASSDDLFLALTDERDGSATVWHTSTGGELKMTVRFINGVASAVTGPEFNMQFSAEKTYFLQCERRDDVTAPEQPTDSTAPSTGLNPAEKAIGRRALLGTDGRLIERYPWILAVIAVCIACASGRPTRRADAEKNVKY
jgi:hypothetical protein